MTEIPSFNDTPVFEDTTRKGQSRAEAIFGDKHDQFNIPTASQSELEFADEKSVGQYHPTQDALGKLAARQLRPETQQSIESYANQHGDNLSQEQLDRIERVHR